jgi:hypothetical protein
METTSPDSPASAEPQLQPVTITLKPAGPIIIEGPVKILNNAGDEVIPPPTKIPGQIKLCGCGFTKTRPFCDGSHNR